MGGDGYKICEDGWDRGNGCHFCPRAGLYSVVVQLILAKTTNSEITVQYSAAVLDFFLSDWCSVAKAYPNEIDQNNSCFISAKTSAFCFAQMA